MANQEKSGTREFVSKGLEFSGIVIGILGILRLSLLQTATGGVIYLAGKGVEGKKH